jgi:hypothetical protein
VDAHPHAEQHTDPNQHQHADSLAPHIDQYAQAHEKASTPYGDAAADPISL